MTRNVLAAKKLDQENVVTIYGATDRGFIRINNQDCYAFDEQAAIAIVADGMGGQAAGDVASQMATETALGQIRSQWTDLQQYAEKSDFQSIMEVLDDSVQYANRCIFECAQKNEDKQGMGTTLDVVLIIYPNLFIAHVGDSRVYRVSNGVAEQLTRDHSLAAAMMAKGTVKFEDVALYENTLLKSIGTSPEVDVDLLRYDLKPGDWVVLCSDGVWHYFRDPDEISAIVRDFPLNPAARFISESLRRGGEDNATAVTVNVHG